jgi:hypothetical protein
MRREVTMMGRWSRIALTGAAAFSFLLAYTAETNAQFGLGAQQGQQRPERSVLSSSTGRYVFGQISDSGKDQFMLDTQTGRVWRVSESSEVGMFLSPVPYKTGEGKYSFLPGTDKDWKPKAAEKR